MPKMKKTAGIGKFELTISGNQEIAYLKLPNYPKDQTLKTSRSFRLVDCIDSYRGPDVVFDFDQNQVLVGIEVLAE